MSKFKPVSAFQNEAAAPAPTTTATASEGISQSVPPVAAPAQPLVPSPTASPVVYDSTPVATAAPSALEVVFERHQERLQQAGSDVARLRLEVAKMASSFDPHRNEAIHTLGSNAGQKVVQYSDKLLAQVKTKDMEGLGDKLNEVVLLAKGVNINAMLDSSKSKIPLIGGLIDSFKLNKEKVLARYNTLSQQIEKLVNEVKTSQTRLANRITELETTYQYNREEYYNLDCVILVGEVKLEELRADLAERQAQPQASDPMQAQQIADLQDVINRLDKRVHDLRTMQMVAIQTAPMIRMVQSNNRMLIDKFRNLQELTIPSWKKQFTLAIALIDQQKAVELTQKIDDTTNELMRRNADLLKQNSINTARASQRAVVDIETLEHVQQTLISTVEEVQQIQREGEQARQEAVGRMEGMKSELIEKLGRPS